jgi:hypothetical protein
MTTDITPENVARVTTYLRTRRVADGFDHTPGVLTLRRKPDVISIEAADMLDALSARVAELEAERNKLDMRASNAIRMLEAAEAKLAASEASASNPCDVGAVMTETGWRVTGKGTSTIGHVKKDKP